MPSTIAQYDCTVLHVSTVIYPLPFQPVCGCHGFFFFGGRERAEWHNGAALFVGRERGSGGGQVVDGGNAGIVDCVTGTLVVAREDGEKEREEERREKSELAELPATTKKPSNKTANQPTNQPTTNQPTTNHQPPTRATRYLST